MNVCINFYSFNNSCTFVSSSNVHRSSVSIRESIPLTMDRFCFVRKLNCGVTIDYASYKDGALRTLEIRFGAVYDDSCATQLSTGGKFFEHEVFTCGALPSEISS